MASAKGLLLSAVGALALREVRIAEIRELAPRLRAITLEGERLRGVAWTPGDKLQLLLPSRDVRTYTPIAWRGATTTIVAFDHGGGPGAVWSQRAMVGETCKFLGPQRSLHRRGPETVVFGDETSLGLIAAFATLGPLAAVLEVGAPREVAAAVTALGLEVELACIERVAGNGHLEECAPRLLAQRTAELVLSGRAQAIQAIQARLRREGVRAAATKAYWSRGKAGLD